MGDTVIELAMPPIYDIWTRSDVGYAVIGLAWPLNITTTKLYPLFYKNNLPQPPNIPPLPKFLPFPQSPNHALVTP